MPVSPNSTQRLFAQLQSANAVVESLGVWRDPVSRELHLQEDPVEVARRLAKGLVEQLKLASALVWFYDATDDALHIQATAGLISPAMAHISQLVPDESPIGALVRSRAPKLSNNLREEPWIQSPHWIESENLVGFAGYPITLGTDLMGCVAVFSHTTLEPEFLEVLQFISTHTASAIATARQAYQLRQQANRDAALRAVGQKLRQAVGVAELLQAMVEAVGEAFQADRVRVTLGLVLSSKVRPKFCPQMYASPQTRAIPIDPQALRAVLKTFAPASSDRDIGWFDLQDSELVTASEDRELLRQNLAHAGYRTLATVPIVLMEAGREEVLAHLYLGWQDSRRLDTERRELLRAIAAQVAVALNKARLLEQFQRQAERQALLYRMTDRIRFSLNLDEILQAAVTEVGEALQASRAQFLFGDSSLESVTYRYAFAQPGIDSWLNRRISLKGNALAMKLFRPDEAIVIKGWSSLYEIEPRNQRALYNAGVQSLMVAGMNLGQDYYGILSVHRCRPDYYTLSADDVTQAGGTGLTGNASTYASTPIGWTDADRKLLKAVAEQLTIAINQSRLYEKTQRQAKREALLNEISADIRNSLDPTRVLESIEQSLAAALELGDCKIQLYDNSIAPPSSSSTVESSDIQQLDLYETLTNGYPLQLSAEDFQYISAAEREFFQLSDVSCCALLPLLQAGELIGTILMTVPCDEPVFPHEKFLLAIAVAEQAGIALKQAQLYDRARRLAQRETLLRHLAQSLTGTSTVGGIIQFALQGMADALGVNRCEFITLSSQHSKQLALSSEDLQQQIGEQIQRNIALSTKVEPESQPAQFKITQRFERDRTATTPVTEPVSEGVPAEKVAEVISDLSWLLLVTCYGQRESLKIEDVRTYPISPQARQNLLEVGIHGLVAVPVTIEEEVLGVLCATVAEPAGTEGGERRTMSGFATAELELLEAIADMTAVAVQRTQFSEQARMRDAMAAAMRGLTEGREAESKRLAADLHDQTIADLGAMSRKMRQLANNPDMDPQERQREISGISQQLQETIAELRCIVEDLQPTAMRAFNLGSALRSLLERAAQRSRTSLLTRFDDRTNGDLNRLEPLAQSTLFRIVQEALNNVVKHAGATRVDCSIRVVDDWLEVKVIDNGRGMPDNPTREGSHGLLNMRYRAALIGGEISWKARKTDTGTIARLVVPLSSQA